jgi:uncharacterized phage protein (TIGR01671 family)
MREIRFRFWSDILKHWVVPDDSILPGVLRGADDKMHALQYTSLKDKNGKEIYEGDLVRWIEQTRIEFGAVTWVNDGFSIAYRDVPDQYRILYYAPELEVVGNIYENPELVKAG